MCVNYVCNYIRIGKYLLQLTVETLYCRSEVDDTVWMITWSDTAAGKTDTQSCSGLDGMNYILYCKQQIIMQHVYKMLTLPEAVLKMVNGLQ